MPVIEKKEREDGIVECLIDSSNILKSEYNQPKNTLILTFKAGTRYKYKDILNRDYIRFEMTDSQGSVFNKTMKKYEYEKLEGTDATLIKERIEEIKKEREI
jgi:alpha-glucosidase (family GH31 glycosyl hydrolase)